MLSNFQTFGFVHLASIFIGVLIGTIFILLAKKYPNKITIINYLLIITIILIRATRYLFDYNLGVFSVWDLFSLHICHINLIILIIAILTKNNKLSTFTFLIGVPTALGVVLFPGKIHPEPGMLRAIFFIMSHTMLIMGSLYLILVNKVKITFQNIKFYYYFSLIAMIAVYVLNTLLKTNYMYLKDAPNKTVLESIYNLSGQYLYLIVIYLILVILLTILYFIYKLISKKN